MVGVLVEAVLFCFVLCFLSVLGMDMWMRVDMWMWMWMRVDVDGDECVGQMLMFILIGGCGL